MSERWLFSRREQYVVRDDEARNDGPREDAYMKKAMIAAIKFYQKGISPTQPPRCRFSPTCSQYAVEAIEKYGALKGGWLATKRLCRCNPFNKGDYFDPVP